MKYINKNIKKNEQKIFKKMQFSKQLAPLRAEIYKTILGILKEYNSDIHYIKPQHCHIIKKLLTKYGEMYAGKRKPLERLASPPQKPKVVIKSWHDFP